jgi:hypothetical protein
MSIRAGYINGKRTYVLGEGSKVHSAHDHYSKVQVFRHQDIVKALNKFLRGIENADNEVLKNSIGVKNIPHELWKILDTLVLNDHLSFEKNNEETIAFDDSQKIKKTTSPRLHTGNKVKKTVNLHVHKGGLYKPSERPTYQADDLLSDEFKAWQRGQRAKTDHHDNA